MNAVVILLVPPFLELTYSLPPEFPESFWKPGLRVAVPLGRGPLRAGVLRTLTPEAPPGVTLRPLCWPLEDEPLLPQDLLALLEDLAVRTCAPVGAAMALTLPFLARTDASLHRMGAGGLHARSRDAVFPLSALRRAPDALRRELAKELVEKRAHMLPPRQDAARSERCVLAIDPPWPLRPAATAQRRMLEYLSFHGPTNRRLLQRALGAGSLDVLSRLVEAGCVRIESDPGEEAADAINESLLAPPEEPVVLNEDQRRAADDMIAALEAGSFAHRLLYGVTGSGKTAVYLAAARRALELGRSVMILAPEVALAHKLRRDVSLALPGADVILYHGYQWSGRREATFRSLAARRTPCLVVGTRSALFLPMPSLGLVVLDEEHDASFKQDDHVPYQAKEVAWYRARHEKALLVLGSATPDLKTWHAVLEGRLPVLRLPSRIAGRPLPPVELVSIAGRKMVAGEDSLLAPQSLRAIGETMARGEQAVILLNRRGYAPLVYCPDCRRTLTCPNCAVGLAFHRDEGRLMCHYCGFSMPFPAPCPECHHMNFLPVGEGTEHVADYLGGRFQCRVLRLDRDSTRRAGAMEEILSRFARHEADMLVGTQMLSKGHHFPEVTLAVVVDGDLGLGLPDYRAAERTFQLLVQSSGRAGRGEKPGRVLIQTRNTDHYCWKYVKTADYEGFYAAEIALRRKYRYPPFVRLAMIRFSYDREDRKADEAMQALMPWLRVEARKKGIPVMGPVPAPIAYLGNRMRYQCLVKAADWQSARTVYHLARLHPDAGRLVIRLDLDPLSML